LFVEILGETVENKGMTVSALRTFASGTGKLPENQSKNAAGKSKAKVQPEIQSKNAVGNPEQKRSRKSKAVSKKKCE